MVVVSGITIFLSRWHPADMSGLQLISRWGGAQLTLVEFVCGGWWCWGCDAEEAATLTMLGGITKHHPKEGSPNIINEKVHQTSSTGRIARQTMVLIML